MTKSPAALVVPPIAPGPQTKPRRFVPLRAKVAIPTVGPELVLRLVLVTRLMDARHKPVVVVAAPAGYGKTVTLVQWAGLDGRPFAWLSLDADDEDPARLVRYLVAAVGRAVALSDELVSLAQQPDSEVELMVALLAAELSTAGPAVLVVDNVGALSEGPARRVLELLVAERPAGCQIVLAGRGAPAVALHELRLQDDLCELYATDLALSGPEAEALVAGTGMSPSDDEVTSWLRRTEGWPAALWLAVRGVRGARAVRTAPLPRRAPVTQFLSDEVIDQLDQGHRDFLVATSVVSVLSAPICDALLGGSGSASRLAELSRPEHRLLVAVDGDGTAFRRHRLLTDLLRDRLAADPRTRRALHERVSEWCEEHHEVAGAIDHAAQAGDLHRAGALILGSLLSFVSQGRAAAVGRWLEHFGPEDQEAHPELGLARSFYELARDDLVAAGRWLAAAEAAPGQGADGRLVGAGLACARALLGPADLGQLAADAARVQALGPADNPWYPLACELHGSALLLMGHQSGARTVLAEAERVSRRYPAVHAATLARLALLSVAEEDWKGALRRSRRALAELEAYGLGGWRPLLYVHALVALTQTVAGDPEVAEKEAQVVVELLGATEAVPDLLTAQVLLFLAEMRQRRTDAQQARSLIAGLAPLLARQPRAVLLATRVAQLRRGEAAYPLTVAERRVLELLPTHLSLREISEQLFLSRNTVKSQAISIYRKLGVPARSPAVERARQLGLLAH